MMRDAKSLTNRQLRFRIKELKSEIKQCERELKHRSAHETNTSIDTLGLSTQAANALKRYGQLKTVEDIVDIYVSQPDYWFLSLRGFGQKSLDQLVDALTKQGFLESASIDPPH